MTQDREVDAEVQALIDEAVSVAISRGDSQAVIDLLSITSEYIDGAEGSEYDTPPGNVRPEVLPESYPYLAQ